ncbi:MAG: methylated-DNA--[protein]-cysteine S-methyltransferase [Armatimonadota bacterium]
MIVAYTTEELPLVGPTTVAVTPDGVCFVSLDEPSAAYNRLCDRYEDDIVASGDQACAKVVRQLREYLTGRRKEFDLPLDPKGTPFQRQVWEAVAAVPYGETRSYGEIAAAVGRPTASRAVGAANGANPICLIVPCHRIIGSGGKLTGYAYGLETKQRLLELEGSASRV